MPTHDALSVRAQRIILAVDPDEVSDSNPKGVVYGTQMNVELRDGEGYWRHLYNFTGADSRQTLARAQRLIKRILKSKRKLDPRYWSRVL